MKKIFLVVTICILNSFSAFAQRGGGPSKSAEPAPAKDTTKSCCKFNGDLCVAKCLFGSPIDFSETKNMIPMNENLWTPAQIIADYKKNRKPGQVGAIVLLKTEFCFGNSSLCAVTTEAFEKNASKYSKLYRVYGAWLYKDTVWVKDDYGDWVPAEDQKKELTDWQQKVYDEYDFDQGPGANIYFLDPRDNEIVYRTDAASLELDVVDVLANDDEVTLLDKALIEGYIRLKQEKSRWVWVKTPPYGIPVPFLAHY